VTNTGNVPLSNVAVTDNRVSSSAISCTGTPGGSNVIPSLAVGAFVTCSATGTAVAGPYTNIGTASDGNVSDTDPSDYFGAAPALSIEKATNGQDADAAPGPTIPVGSTVTWTYVVTNTGNVPLSNIAVTDDREGAITCPKSTLAAGEQMTCTKNGTATAGQYSNLGTASGSFNGTTVQDTDPSHYFGAAPALSMLKKTNGTDNNSAPGPTVVVGSTVTWTYQVTNTGNVPLSNIAVTDDRLPNSAISCTGAPGGSNVIPSLAVGASVTCQASGQAQAGQYANVGTATSGTTTASDPDHYFGATLSIDIEKATNGHDADSAPGPTVQVGSAVTWTYVVTNTGNVPLTNVTVTDDQLLSSAISCTGEPGGSNVIASLAAGASHTCTATGTASAGQYSNLGTATGSYNGTTVTDTDPSHYFGEEPAGAVLLIIDEDGIDNGLHVNKSGGWITPSGPQFWTASEVNDDLAAYGFRNVLRYFASSANFNREITVRTGQTGDEGWFAPHCIPRKWLGSSASSSSNECLSGADRTIGIHNYFFSGKTPFTGAPGSWNIPQSRLDKIPHVRPLRALGLQTLVGKDVCALVYDSDISINYDHGTPLGVNGNLQGATLGIAAFHVISVHTLNNFSSSTLPQVRIRVLNPAAACTNFQLYNAPVPNSSSVPNDRVVPSVFNYTGSNSYRSIATGTVFN
jgi:uncharacterized repeat protein (TIGR01451 family)